MIISDWLSAQILNACLRNIPFTPPTTIFLALYISAPTSADTGTEVTGGGYTRVPITFGVPVLENGKMTVKNVTDVEFPIANADWGLVTHVGLRTAAAGGNLMWAKALDNQRTIQAGDKPKFLKDGTLVRFVQ